MHKFFKMKRFASVIIAGIMLASCGNAPEGTTKIEMPAEESATSTETAAPTGPMDPVCEMVKDSTWTEYTVHNNDTVWFCSDVCKGVFAKNPEKYVAKAQ